MQQRTYIVKHLKRLLPIETRNAINYLLRDHNVHIQRESTDIAKSKGQLRKCYPSERKTGLEDRLHWSVQVGMALE